MVQDPKHDNSTLMQRREAEDRRVDAPLPYPGEIVGRKTPPFEVTGVDALSPLLMHVSFPASREEVIAAIGQALIPIDKQHTMSVADVLERTAPLTFRSSAEVEAAVKQIWQGIRPHDDRGGRHWQRDDTSARDPN